MRRLSFLKRGSFGMAVLLGLLCLVGCPSRPANEPLVKAGMYQGSAEELQRLWTDILTACQRDDRVRVHELMVSFLMTKDELQSLIGPQQANALWARYQAMLGSLANAGAVELVAHIYEKKYDDIAVQRIDTLPAAEQADTDRNFAQALRSPLPFYTVRVKKKTETRGLRYDVFFYRNGYWRSGNLLGKFLPPAPALPSPADAATTSPSDGGAAVAPPASAPASPQHP